MGGHGRGWCWIRQDIVKKGRERVMNRAILDLQDSYRLLLTRLAAVVEIGEAVRQVCGQAGDRIVSGAGTSKRLGSATDAGKGAGSPRASLGAAPRRRYLAAPDDMAVDMGRRYACSLQRGREAP